MAGRMALRGIAAGGFAGFSGLSAVRGARGLDAGGSCVRGGNGGGGGAAKPRGPVNEEAELSDF